MANRQDAIRHIYDEHQGDDFWPAVKDWAARGDNWRERWSRWRALQRFCQGQRDNSAGEERHKWNWRRRFARRRKINIWDNAHEPKPAPTPQTGCGGSGYPEWSGGRSICEYEVVPVATRYGVPVTSRKRTTTLGNPSSDHYVGNTTAYAVDLGTFSGANLAHAIANALGISGYSTGNYNGYYITRCSKRFRVQILWAVSGHYNHVHVGVRLA
jgi:hypothetical protein